MSSPHACAAWDALTTACEPWHSAEWLDAWGVWFVLAALVMWVLLTWDREE